MTSPAFMAPLLASRVVPRRPTAAPRATARLGQARGRSSSQAPRAPCPAARASSHAGKGEGAVAWGEGSSRRGPLAERALALAASVVVGVGLGAPQALAELPSLPETPLGGSADPVLDYGKVLSARAEATLEREIRELEDATGWKLRVLTGYGPNSTPDARTLRGYWRADEKTIIATWDESQGNILDFRYAISVFDVIPKNVFQELRGQFGNQYYIRDEGTEGSVLRVTSTLNTCLMDGGCKFVPGLEGNTRLFSVWPVVTGAALFGAVMRNELSRWTYFFLFIWAPWVFLFGFLPIYQRQPDDLTPIFQNLGIFAVVFGFFYLTPLFGNTPTLPFVSGSPDGQAAPPMPQRRPRQEEEGGGEGSEGKE